MSWELGRRGWELGRRHSYCRTILCQCASTGWRRGVRGGGGHTATMIAHYNSDDPVPNCDDPVPNSRRPSSQLGCRSRVVVSYTVGLFVHSSLLSAGLNTAEAPHRSWELGRRELGTGSSWLGTGSSPSFDVSNKCRMTPTRRVPICVATDRPGRGVSAEPKVGNWVVAYSTFLMIVVCALASQTCFVAP